MIDLSQDFDFDIFKSIYEEKLSNVDTGSWKEKFLSVDTEKRLYSICCTLRENAKKFNLTSIVDPDGMTEKHIIDSILPLSVLENNVDIDFSKKLKIIDIGAGAGFPSLPLACVLAGTGVNILALDSTSKKTVHILESAKRAGIPSHISTQAARAEEFAHTPKIRERFDIATARAVAALPVLIELCGAFVKVGGYFIALKSHCDDEIAESENAATAMGFDSCIRLDYALPCGDTRSLCVYKKIKSTEIIYPRQYSKISAKHL